MTKLIIINGFPASGKTTLSRKISSELHLPLFSKDSFKELLADSLGFNTHEDSHALGKTSFELLVLTTKECLSKKHSIIIEGNFSLGQIMKDFLDWVQGEDIQVYEILCYADGELLVERFRKRKRHPVHHTLPEAELEHYFQSKLSLGKDLSLGVGRLFEVDTTRTETIPYEEIKSFLLSK
jgi:cytidylate kinase